MIENINLELEERLNYYMDNYVKPDNFQPNIISEFDLENSYYDPFDP